MYEHFRRAFATMRGASGLSLADVARATGYGKTTVAQVETGARNPTGEMAARLDALFGSAPLLRLYLDGSDDDVNRRTALRMMTMSLAAGAVVGGCGRDSLEAAVRVDTELDQTGTLDRLVDRYRREFLLGRGPDFADTLFEDLRVTRERAREASTEAQRGPLLGAAAMLSLLYGMHTADGGKLVAAYGWYDAARSMGEASGDAMTLAYIEGRVAGRGPYERLTVREVRAGISRALSLHTRDNAKSAAVVEALGAEVHLAALMGKLPEARGACDAMHAVATELPDPGHPANDIARWALYYHYAVCRIGESLADAERVHGEVRELLRPVSSWWADAGIYWGMALVRFGEVEEGVRVALAAIKSRPWDVAIHTIGVRDLICAVPAGYTSDELDELAGYASTRPGPWETLVA